MQVARSFYIISIILRFCLVLHMYSALIISQFRNARTKFSQIVTSEHSSYSMKCTLLEVPVLYQNLSANNIHNDAKGYQVRWWPCWSFKTENWNWNHDTRVLHCLWSVRVHTSLVHSTVVHHFYCGFATRSKIARLGDKYLQGMVMALCPVFVSHVAGQVRVPGSESCELQKRLVTSHVTEMQGCSEINPNSIVMRASMLGNADRYLFLEERSQSSEMYMRRNLPPTGKQSDVQRSARATCFAHSRTWHVTKSSLTSSFLAAHCGFPHAVPSRNPLNQEISEPPGHFHLAQDGLERYDELCTV